MIPMSTLTRAEARARARQLSVHAYTIHLDLENAENHDTFTSTTTVEFTAHHEGDTFIELRPTAIQHLTLDNHPLDPRTLTDGRLPLSGLTTGHHTLHVTADMPFSRTSEGMHRFTDPADQRTYLYSMCFQTEAPHIYPCFDQPDLKATFTVSASLPESWTFLTNTVATRTPGTPTHWTSGTTPPLSTYLLAVAAGPYHSVHTEHAGIPFSLHSRQSLAPHLDADAEELLDTTRRVYDQYAQLFDEPYPFDSYDQLFAPELNAGAMENPGLVTISDDLVFRSAVTDTERRDRAVTLAHEMAHMWFGDLVTLQWWDDIWLNESFAEYMGEDVLSSSTHWANAWTDFGAKRKAWGYDADQRPSTHPVAPTPEEIPDTATALQNFDGISYAKGASALRQLVAWLGPKEFLAGVNTHITRHKYGNATLDDFLNSLARHTNRDVHSWSAQWLRTTGADTLTPHTTETEHQWQLHINQQGTRPHRIHVGTYDRAPEDPTTLTLREHVETDLTPEKPTTLTLQGPRPDLILLNDHDLTWAKLRFDPQSWDTVRAGLTSIPSSLTRAVIWNTARDLVRDGQLPATEYLDTLQTHLPHETDNANLAAALTFARHHVSDQYLTPHQRPQALDTLHNLTHHILTTTDRPDLQLTALRTYITSTTNPGDLTPWLDGNTTPYDINLDPELRWLVLHRLTVLEATTSRDIKREAAQDPTATGQQAAARCHAALPDPASKSETWTALFDPQSTLSNRQFTATAQGFWPPEQHDLTHPYRSRYFPDAVQLATRKGDTIAKLAGKHAFPHTAVTHEVLQQGHHTLNNDNPPPGLHRQLVDQLDDLRRALDLRDS